MIVVIDLETTGVDPQADCIVELAGVSIDTAVVKTGSVGPSAVLTSALSHAMRDQWSGLVKPTMPIPPQASAVHHLTDGDFRFAWPDFKAAWDHMHGLDGLGCEGDVDCFVGHNVLGFDKPFVEAALPGGLSGDVPWLDTWRCALHLYPDSPGHSNMVLRYALRLQPAVPPGLAPHRALYDTVVTASLLLEMLETHTLPELLELQHRPVLLKTCQLKKHRGTPWAEVPRDYLSWIVNKSDFKDDVLYTAKHYLSK
jgi:exodeoxyribonuclease X